MKKLLFITFLFLVSILAACAPAQTEPAISMTDVQNTVTAIIQTQIVLAQTSLPTATQEATPTKIVRPTPSLYPTQTPYTVIITPDATHVERWMEYQTALAQKTIYKDYAKFALCEWEFLGRDELEVYVWATCATSGVQTSRPAVIYLEADGSILNVEIPNPESPWWDSDFEGLFPADVQEIIASYGHIVGPQEMLDHIYWRQEHREVPPLIILSAMPTSTASFIITPVLTSTPTP